MDSQQKDQIALRKRTLIAKSNRTMFLWVAVVSVVIGAAAVIGIFLFQKLLFNEKVLGEKEKTVSTLNANNKAVSGLEEEMRVLDTNEALGAVKATGTDQALQVVLDALPSSANSPALGASLQNKLLAGVDGISLESLQVQPVQGVELLSEGTSAAADNSISFSFSVRGPQSSLAEVLTRLERSIRTIKVLSITIQGQSAENDSATMSVQGLAYYEPGKKIQLIPKVVKP